MSLHSTNVQEHSGQTGLLPRHLPWRPTAAGQDQSLSLKGTPLGRLLRSDEERHALEYAAAPALALRSSGDLIREGDGTDNLYLVSDGWALRYKTTCDGARQIVGVALPGEFANIDSLLFDRLDFGVVLCPPARSFAIPRTRIRALARQHAGIARALTALALIENAMLAQLALNLGRKSARQRIAHWLCELSVRLGNDDDPALRFHFPITQERLADLVGLTPVHVNRVIQQLRAEKLIVMSNRTLTIIEPQILRSEADFDPSYLHLEVARG